MKNYKLILVFFNSLNKCTNAHYILNKGQVVVDKVLTQHSLWPRACARVCARVRVEVKRGVC